MIETTYTPEELKVLMHERFVRDAQEIQKNLLNNTQLQYGSHV